MKQFLILVSTILLVIGFGPNNSTFCQSLDHLDLIAHYPLSSDANDVTGNNAAMELVNTPFQDGGILATGVYVFSGEPNGCDAKTPELSDFRFAEFAISAKFKVSEYDELTRPVFVGGDNFRWISVWLTPDSTVLFGFNDAISSNSTAKYSVNTWHTATVTYDSLAGLGKLYLDNVAIDSVNFDIVHGDDKNVSITHFGVGLVFKGIFGDLKVYSKSGGITAVSDKDDLVHTSFQLFPNYPNPVRRSTTIRFNLKKQEVVKLTVSNQTGQEMAVLVDGLRPSGLNEVIWSPKNLPAGSYFYRLQVGDYEQSNKLVLLK